MNFSEITNLNTFGNHKEFTMLPPLMVELDKLPKNEKNYISHFLHEFCLVNKHLQSIDDYALKMTMLTITRNYYQNKINQLPSIYTPISSFLNNFVKAKFKKTLKMENRKRKIKTGLI